MDTQPLFLNDWNEDGLDALKAAFGLTDAALAGHSILLASYSRDAYCGEAFVLFQQRRQLYEVNASHDSGDCMNGQWEPEETLLDALEFRLEKGRLGLGSGGTNLFADELRFLIAELRANGFS